MKKVAKFYLSLSMGWKGARKLRGTPGELLPLTVPLRELLMPLGKLLLPLKLSWIGICALRVLSLPLELIAPLIIKLAPLLGVLMVPLLGTILRMPA